MREFVGDDIVRELLRTVRQSRSQYHTATAAADRSGTRHPQRPAHSRLVVLQSNAESRVVEKVSLNLFRKLVQDDEDSLAKRSAFRE